MPKRKKNAKKIPKKQKPAKKKSTSPKKTKPKKATTKRSPYKYNKISKQKKKELEILFYSQLEEIEKNERPVEPVKKPIPIIRGKAPVKLKPKAPKPEKPKPVKKPAKPKKETKPLKRLKYKGKYISNEFERYVRAASKAARKKPQQVLDNPEYTKLIENLLEKNKATTYKKVKTIAKTLKKTGKTKVEFIYPDGTTEMISAAEAVKRLARIEQRMRKKNEVVYFSPKTIQWINGKFSVYALETDFDSEELEDYINSSDVEYMVYEED